MTSTVWNMFRTMVYLDTQDRDSLLQRAKSAGTSMAQLIRDAIRQYLQQPQRAATWATDPIWRCAALAADGPARSDAEHHDAVLYRGC